MVSRLLRIHAVQADNLVYFPNAVGAHRVSLARNRKTAQSICSPAPPLRPNCTPGTSTANCTILRPFSGSSVMRVFSTTPPTVAFSVCRLTARGNDLDGLGYLADLEFEIGSYLGACLYMLGVDSLRLKSFQTANDVVVSNSHQSEGVVPGLVCRGRCRDAGGEVGDGHGRAGHHGLRRIGDQTLDRLWGGLRLKKAETEKSENNN